jgi:hypothetical protein
MRQLLERHEVGSADLADEPEDALADRDIGADQAERRRPAGAAVPGGG